MKHPSIFGARMAGDGSGRFGAEVSFGAFRVSAELILEGERWFSEIFVNGLRVYRSLEGFRTLQVASDRLARVAGQLEWAAEKFCEGEAQPVAPTTGRSENRPH